MTHQYRKSDRLRTRIYNLPQSYRNRSGHLGFLRGRRDGPNDSRIQLYAWDFVGNCSRERCPVFRYCEKQPDPDSGSHQKCPIQLEYIRQTANVILNCYEDIDEVTAFKIGTHLIPLYSDLVLLKLTRSGLDHVVLTSNRGSISIHPVLKEIRETHRRILATWNELGLKSTTARKELENLEPDFKKGDSTLYSRMMASKNKEKMK